MCQHTCPCACAVSKALEQLDTASRDAAAAKQRVEQLEQEHARTQQQAQSAQAQVDRLVACFPLMSGSSRTRAVARNSPADELPAKEIAV